MSINNCYDILNYWDMGREMNKLGTIFQFFVPQWLNTCSKSTIKSIDNIHGYCCDTFIFNFEQVFTHVICQFFDRYLFKIRNKDTNQPVGKTIIPIKFQHLT